MDIYKYILVLLCEVSNFLVTIPLREARAENVLQAIQVEFIKNFGPPTHIICDLDPAFTSSLVEAFAQHFNIKIITVSVTNHKSLLAEHGIKSLANMLVKHLSETWSWVNTLPYAMLCYNSYSSPNLDDLSPYELVFGRKASLFPQLELKPEVVVTGNFQEYYKKLRKNLHYLCERLQKFRSNRVDMLNRNKEFHSLKLVKFCTCSKQEAQLSTQEAERWVVTDMFRIVSCIRLLGCQIHASSKACLWTCLVPALHPSSCRS